MNERLVFIHSTGLGPFMWAPYAQALPQWQPLCPVNLGYQPGQEIPRGTHMQVAQEVDHLMPQLQALKQPVHLVAHSYGGLVALEVARRAQVPVASLFLYEPVLFFALRDHVPDLHPEAQADMNMFYNEWSLLQSDETGGDETWLAHFVDYWNSAGAWANMSDKARQAMRRVSWKMYMEVRAVTTHIGAFSDYALPASLPITLLHGEHTPHIAREVNRYLATHNPQAVQQELAQLGHMGVIQHPAPVLQALQTHLARCPAPVHVAEAERPHP